MHTPKVVKLYFTFVMTIVAISALSSFPASNEYMKVALAFFDFEVDEPRDDAFDFHKYLQASANSLSVTYDNPFDIHFDFVDEASNSYARPGEDAKEMMKIVISSSEAPVVLDSLKLKLTSVEAKKINSAKLISGEKVLSNASVNGEYFNFSGIGYKLAAGDEGSISLVLSLGEDLRPHDVLRFDLETEEDIGIKVGGMPYVIKGYYPIKGASLFIVK